MKFFSYEMKRVQCDGFFSDDQVTEVYREEQERGNGKGEEGSQTEGRHPEGGDQSQKGRDEDLEIADVPQHGTDDLPEDDHLVDEDRQFCDQRADGGAAGSVFRDQDEVEDEVDDGAEDLGMQDRLLLPQRDQDLDAEDVGEADEDGGRHEDLHGLDGAHISFTGEQHDALTGEVDEVDRDRESRDHDEVEGLGRNGLEVLHAVLLDIIGRARQQDGAERRDDADEDVLDLDGGVVITDVDVRGHEAEHDGVEVCVHRGGDGHGQEDGDRFEV